MILHRLDYSQLGQHNYWLAWIFLCLILCVNSARAEDGAIEAVKDEFWSIQLENDFFAQSGDRYYTHGTEISRTVMGEPPAWLKVVTKLFPIFESNGVITGVNYSIGQKIFTPSNTEATEVVLNDRPYAGYLYFSAAMLSSVSSNDNTDVGNLVEFTIGVVGPASLAEDTQTKYHDLIGIDSPNGWDNQLQEELGVGFSYLRFWRQVNPYGSLNYGMTPHVNIVLGNIYTYAATGVMFRFGTHLNGDLSPPNIRPGFPGLSLFRPGTQNNWYVFAGIEGRAVARNIFLDGNTFEDSHSVNKKTFVGDIQFGLVFQSGNVRYSLSNMIRTKEFESQPDETIFGAINVSFLL